MDLIKLLIIFSLFSIIPGQLIRLPLGSSGAINFSDTSIFLCDFVFLIHAFLVKKNLKFPTSILLFFALFTMWATSSTLLALNNFTFLEVVTGSLFLIRFVIYFLFTIVVFNTVAKTQVLNWINIFLTVTLVFIFLGFAQLLFFPDLSFLSNYGWDPHQTRIVSTLLDPNFTGIAAVIFFSVAISAFTFKKEKKFALFAVLFFCTIILTFSRSAYLAFFAVIFIVGLLKSVRTLAIFALIFAFSFILIPQVKIRVIGALTVDETSSARIESWQNAIKVFGKNPIFGVGFNTYRYAQNKYSIFDETSPDGGHSGAGSDSSLLLILATTGIFGLIFYLMFLAAIIKNLLPQVKKSFPATSALSSLAGLLVNSQFVNSLFFPQIMVLIFFIIGLTLSSSRLKKPTA